MQLEITILGKLIKTRKTNVLLFLSFVDFRFLIVTYNYVSIGHESGGKAI